MNKSIQRILRCKDINKLKKEDKSFMDIMGWEFDLEKTNYSELGYLVVKLNKNTIAYITKYYGKTELCISSRGVFKSYRISRENKNKIDYVNLIKIALINKRIGERDPRNVKYCIESFNSLFSSWGQSKAIRDYKRKQEEKEREEEEKEVITLTNFIKENKDLISAMGREFKYSTNKGLLLDILIFNVEQPIYMLKELKQIVDKIKEVK